MNTKYHCTGVVIDSYLMSKTATTCIYWSRETGCGTTLASFFPNCAGIVGECKRRVHRFQIIT